MEHSLADLGAQSMSGSNEKTALITGASGGIGVDFANELAARGYDLIITARNGEKLEANARRLEEMHSVKVEPIISDLGESQAPLELFEKIQSSGRRIDALINNAGVGHFKKFLTHSVQEIDQAIDLNIRALTVLTRLFGKHMSENGGGLILNHASFSGIQPPSDFAVYAASKAYVMNFSLAVRENIKDLNVSVSVLCPGYFDSDFISKAGQPPGVFMKWLLLKQSKVAESGIRGMLKKKAVIIPSLRYKSFAMASRFLPRTVNVGIADIAVSRWNKKN